ncbi:PREDICTED: zinc finger and SCAN domain-containing protein 2-like [Dufourea novaeangliae]|uniref:zinc finger and SCAN domain-containing protein 2-like n=1 Tax=Dufourea novaeangliae TaxID=178035 RepID=UPI00076777E7|nr:PREDICTED: zinc finger and SCAN domain-containing protein 2-like [Dufourea novaeangliae]
MESESTIVLESSGDDSILIQTVKNIVSENAHAELESEEEGFFVATDEEDGQQNMIEVSTQESAVTQNNEQVSWSNLCRVCANTNDHVIPIFEEEGLQHDLCSKIHKYLPIHLSEADTLPLQLCYHCAATLLAWHELLEGCLNAERRLLEMQDVLQEKKGLESLEVTTEDMIISNVSESHHQQQEIVKDEECEEIAVNDSDRCINRGVGLDERSNESSNTRIRVRSITDLENCAPMIDNVGTSIERRQNEPTENTVITHDVGASHVAEERDEVAGLITDPVNCVPVIDKVETIIEPTENTVITLNVSASRVTSESDEVTCSKTDLEKCASVIDKIGTGIEPTENVVISPMVRAGRFRGKRTKEVREVLNRSKVNLNGVTRYQCSECGRTLSTSYNFLIHRYTHTGEKPCTCQVCGKKFRTASGLNRHVREVHIGIKKFACDICGRRQATAASRDEHRRIHTGERPHVCETCGDSFKQKSCLNAHKLVHTKRFPHQCSLCGQSFRRELELHKHVCVHTAEPQKPYYCSVCDKQFGSSSAFSRHKRVHDSPQTVYICSICSTRFSQERYMKYHMKKHHKDLVSLE